MKQKKAGVAVTKISLSRKRKGGFTKITPVIARKMMEIQATHYGKLSSRRFCGKMKLENMDFSERSVFRWCNALGIKKYKRYIKPKLKPHHYISRLEWVLDGCVLYMQQDGARPHTTDANLQHTRPGEGGGGRPRPGPGPRPHPYRPRTRPGLWEV